MKVLQANVGALTNFEVLDFLRLRGAANDPTRVLVAIAPSEFKVYDHLEQSAARDQTREIISDFMEKSKKFDLAKAEILNILNIRPSSAVELDPIVEKCEERLGKAEEEEAMVNELVNLVAEVLPPPPTEIKTEGEDASEDADVASGEENQDEQEMEAS